MSGRVLTREEVEALLRSEHYSPDEERDLLATLAVLYDERDALRREVEAARAFHDCDWCMEDEDMDARAAFKSYRAIRAENEAREQKGERHE